MKPPSSPARPRPRGATLLCAAAAVLLGLAACSGDDTPLSDGGTPPPGDASPPGPDQKLDPPVTVSLATWNVKNLFDAEDDPHKQDDVPSSASVKAKISRVGTALRRLNADLVALQEVENRKILERLLNEELSGQNYELRIIEGNDIRGIDVALLVRKTIVVEEYKTHVFDSFKGVAGDTKTYSFSRDCPEVTLRLGAGRRLVLLINHLRSGQDAEAEARRKAQARRVREIADARLKADPAVNLAVVGDLNDGPDSAAVKLITDGTPALHDLLGDLPRHERYTTRFKDNQGLYLQLDYIIAAPGLRKDLKAGSLKVERDSDFHNASDHFPVRATFVVE